MAKPSLAELLKTGELDAARTAAEGRLKASPNDREALVALAKLATLDADFDTARALVAKADILQPDDVDSLLVKASISAQTDEDVEKSIELYQKAIAAAKPPRAEAFFGHGMVLASAGRFHTAAAELQKAVKLEPSVGQFQFHLARVLLADEQLEAGLPHLEKAIELNPLYPPVYEAAVFVLNEFGHQAASENLLNEGLKLMPGQPFLRALLSNVLVSQGKLAPALKITSELAAEHPEDVAVLASQARLLIAKEEYAQADELVTRIESLGSTPQGYMLRARLCEVSDPADLDGAIASYAAAAQADHRDWASLNNLGQLLLQREGDENENLEAACEALEAAAARAPHRLEPLLNLALANARLKREKEARELAEVIVERASAAQADLKDQAARLVKALRA